MKEKCENSEIATLKAERDAAVHDLEKMLLIAGNTFERDEFSKDAAVLARKLCIYCNSKNCCYGRCAPKWRGLKNGGLR